MRLRKLLVPLILVASAATARAQEPPKTLQIQGDLWEVSVFSFDHITSSKGYETFFLLEGYTLCNTRQIWLDNRNDEERKERVNTLLHEATHAEACKRGGTNKGYTYYNSSDPGSHEGIYHIADAMEDLLTHNPELLKWIGEYRVPKLSSDTESH